MSIDPSINSNNVGNSSNISTSTSAAYTTSPLFQSLAPDIQADLIESFTATNLNSIFSTTGDLAPSLPPPEFDTSISQFYAQMSKVARDFRNQLAAAQQLDFSQSRFRSILGLASYELGLLVDQDTKLAQQAKTKAATAISSLKTTFTKVEQTVDDQNTAIDDINSGYSNEKTQASSLTSNFNTYINNLKSLGATASPPPADAYTIPKGSTDAQTASLEASYKTYASTYTNQVSSFNTYWQSRSDDITTYNNGTDDYNQSATDNSQTMQDFIVRYDLQSYVQDKGISSSFLQPSSSKTDSISTPYSYPGSPSPTTVSLPAEVIAPTPPSWIATTGTTNANSRKISNISYTPLTNAQIADLQKTVEKTIYQNSASALQTQIESLALLVYQQLMLNLLNEQPDPREHPLANLKTLFKQIFPNAYTDSEQIAGTTTIRGGNSLTAFTLAKAPHIAELMGRGVLAVALNAFGLRLIAERSELFNNSLQSLTFNLLGANSLESLLPSLGPIADILATLPTNSPVFALLFSISLANRLIETISNGGTLEALKNLLSQFPELASLSADQIKQLEAIINTTALLVATNLIALNAGQPELVPTLISSTFLPESISPQILQDGLNEFQVQLDTIRQNIQASYQSQGFSQEEADFLSDVGTEALARNLPTAPSPTVISNDTIDRDILKRSIEAGIILSRSRDFQSSERIAKQAVERTLSESPFPSIEEFKGRLERQLRNAGIPRNEARTIAEQAVTVSPGPPPTLSLKDILLITNRIVNVVRRNELFIEFKTNIANLLTPQIGGELSQAVTDELATALYGTPNPDPFDQANVKSPFSLVNMIKSQLQYLDVENNKEYTTAVANLFKEYMKPSIELNAFLERLMNPAYHFLYATAEAGIMYGQTGQKKAIDVPV